MSEPTRDAVSAIVGQIYEAAYNRHFWREAITSIANVFGGSRACIVQARQSHFGAIGSVEDSDLISPSAATAFFDDPWFQLTSHSAIGDVVHRAKMLDEAAFRRRDLWNDWLKSRDMYDGMTCKLVSKPDEEWWIDVHRGNGKECFGGFETELFRLIASHARRAGLLSAMLEKTEGMASAFLRLPFGIALVNRHMRVGQINETADSLLVRGDSPLRISRGKIFARAPRDDLSLQQLVFASCSPIDLEKPGVGAMFLPSVCDGTTRTRLSLSIAPFPGSSLYGLATEPSAVILIQELAINMPSLVADFRKMFDLTPAEARIANALATGRSLQQAADANGIRISTARSYLESTFRKTGTHRQGELIALLKTAIPHL